MCILFWIFSIILFLDEGGMLEGCRGTPRPAAKTQIAAGRGVGYPHPPKRISLLRSRNGGGGWEKRFAHGVVAAACGGGGHEISGQNR